MDSKSPIDLSEARTRLLGERQRLMERRESHDHDREELEGNRAIEASEAASTDELRDELAQLGEAERNRLMSIDLALARIESGDYGVCIDCGEEIDPARLRAMPEAERCVTDAEEWAIDERRAPDRRTSPDRTDREGGHRIIPARRPGLDEM